MKLTTGIAATVHTAGPTDPTELDARVLVFAAFPPLMGQPGVEIEKVEGAEWLVTFPTEGWEAIQERGFHQVDIRTSEGHWAKLTVES